MKNSTKLEKVKKFLDENGIRYAGGINAVGKRDLWLPDTKVAIKIDGEDGDLFFTKYRKCAYPVFIRDNETPMFVIEKLQNTIIKSMMREQKRIMRKKERTAKK